MVQTGLARVIAAETAVLRGARAGLIANPTSVDAHLRHAVDVLSADPSIDLRVLFGPEHGLRGAAQDMIAVDDGVDARTGLPLFSLYGHDTASLTPPADALADIDVLVFDIQDIGSRYYTYVWTMVLAMRACAAHGVRFVVLDRPNPLGGAAVEGGAIDHGYESFVGLCSLPNRHGLTAGEIALWRREVEQLDVEVDVVELRGWSRDMGYADTQLPWVMPSPNMPTCDTALVYPGMCLVEGTELSEGRGTTRPFELAGAPFVDGHALAARLDSYGLPGVAFRPLSFLPTFQKHAGAVCGGVQLHVTDAAVFKPYATGVAFVLATRSLWPDTFAWRTRAYEFVDTIPAFDLLAGNGRMRALIEADAPLADIEASWLGEQEAFVAARAEWLLYQ